MFVTSLQKTLEESGDLKKNNNDTSYKDLINRPNTTKFYTNTRMSIATFDALQIYRKVTLQGEICHRACIPQIYSKDTN